MMESEGQGERGKRRGERERKREGFLLCGKHSAKLLTWNNLLFNNVLSVIKSKIPYLTDKSKLTPANVKTPFSVTKENFHFPFPPFIIIIIIIVVFVR